MPTPVRPESDYHDGIIQNMIPAPKPAEFDPTLLPLLVCPRHRLPFAHHDSSLVCPRGDSYAIIEGIPILLLSEASQTHVEGTRSLEVASQGAAATLPRFDIAPGDIDPFVQKATTGVDLSKTSLDRARRRCELSGLTPDLRLADAENLPFPDHTFDIVYSYGVMHHSPDTARCLQQAFRVLKPGGQARIMLYHHASLTGLMLWLRYGLWRAQSIRQCVYDRLESPGTKTFTIAEVRSLMKNFDDVQIAQVFSPGDLLLHQPSARFQRPIYRIIWKLFPRAVVRKLGRKWGLFLLIRATKASATTS